MTRIIFDIDSFEAAYPWEHAGAATWFFDRNQIILRTSDSGFAVGEGFEYMFDFTYKNVFDSLKPVSVKLDLQTRLKPGRHPRDQCVIVELTDGRILASWGSRNTYVDLHSGRSEHSGHDWNKTILYEFEIATFSSQI